MDATRWTRSPLLGRRSLGSSPVVIGPQFPRGDGRRLDLDGGRARAALAGRAGTEGPVPRGRRAAARHGLSPPPPVETGEERTHRGYTPSALNHRGGQKRLTA